MLPFANREQAGRRLGAALEGYSGRPDVTVLALARGGLAVGYQVAETLEAPLDVFLVRKLGVPGHEELAMGAIASGGVRSINDDIVKAIDISAEEIERAAARETAELKRREQAYRDGRPPEPTEGRTVILVDDGLATGASMMAAVKAVRERNPASVVVAVPVAAPEVCSRFQQVADHVVCLETPSPFQAVGAWYEEFPQTSDDEVREILHKARSRRKS
jgi:predicted phosphoribosyltransferase